MLQLQGPLLLAANHPNSFLDSVLLDTLFREPVWSLARGDVFKKPFHRRLLTALRILPVYRTSEGVENLSENYKTFEACMALFRKKGCITIFSEGKCINEWHLRPLKKGTARLALKAWEEGIPLRVLPVGINYSSFERFGKNVFLHFGNPIEPGSIPLAQPDGLRHQAFNALLESELRELVFEVPRENESLRLQRMGIRIPAMVRILLAVPAIAGWLLHAPFYMPIKKYVYRRTAGTDHYDSVLLAVLLLTYPLYLLLLLLTGLLLAGNWGWLTFVVLPFTAWSYVQVKRQ